MASYITLLQSRVEGLGPMRLATLRRAVRDNGGRPGRDGAAGGARSRL